MASPEARAALSDYRTFTTLPVQWGDQDAFGHVNNVVYFRWYETARIAYLRQFELEGFDVELGDGRTGPILASIKCDYKRQLHFPDTVHIGTRVASIGNSSLIIDHTLYSDAQQAIIATGTSTIVVFNYDSNRPIRVPGTMREVLAEFEGREF